MGFVGRSLLVLMVLYGLVFAIGDMALMGGSAPVWWGVAFVTGIILAQYLASPWIIEWVYSIDFEAMALPEAQREFVERLCKERGLPVPRMGIIYSGTPNAFAFGRVRGDARVVMTEGLLAILTEDEANAVLAHEVGHIAHYDFAVMTLASIAPLLLYQIYVWTRRINNHGRVVSYFAYVAYWVGQFLVLLLNRTREYGADHFSAEVTRAPGALSSALVKIGYGMVRERSELQRLVKEGSSKEYKRDAERALSYGQSVSLMGIASVTGNEAMALAAAGGGANAEQAARVMRWDLVNPWSRFYELGSTHPLTAMRLKALNREAARMGQEAAYPLPEDARVRWGGFPVEVVFWGAPLVCGFALVTWFWLGKSLREMGLELPVEARAWLMILLGVTWAARIAFRYRGRFERKNVGELLDDMGVSQMRPRAVEMSGEILGHGVPGAIWSPDLVLQDATGMMFVLYRSSVPLGRLFFALRSADRMVGERVTVQGWYRRGLKPYVELARVQARVTKARKGGGMTTLFGGEGSEAPVEYEELVERSYSRWIQLGVSAGCVVVGVVWLLG